VVEKELAVTVFLRVFVVAMEVVVGIHEFHASKFLPALDHPVAPATIFVVHGVEKGAHVRRQIFTSKMRQATAIASTMKW
jgi:hypothetical protein